MVEGTDADSAGEKELTHVSAGGQVEVEVEVGIGVILCLTSFALLMVF